MEKQAEEKQRTISALKEEITDLKEKTQGHAAELRTESDKLRREHKDVNQGERKIETMAK